ncbi:MAG: cell division ATP-binding protein FtsE [Candidatus Eremiobacteraeota bacterium]|nr:cell division ATP-binding protein FtsE [Candidatus Eremiobacteraeota bacterium]MBC5828516.1 cell division ATP-binding protein FtsE [Candidatus Eremiobacteraeota bacterium]
MIAFQDVSLVYPNGVHALSHIDLTIGRGEFLFLVGSTGQGKSSLLKCVYREVLPVSGEVTVDGRPLSALRRGQVPFLRRKIGVVFQDFKLLHQKTVWENVAYALQVTGAGSRDVLRRVPRTLELVGIAHKSKMFPYELSGGEQQRTAIARALVNNPLILLCDEPTGNLDPETSSEITALLARINTKGTTVVVATHNQAAVDRMRRRVVRMINGRIAHDEERGHYHIGLG